MLLLLLFFDMNNIYTFSGWWYFVCILDLLLSGGISAVTSK